MAAGRLIAINLSGGYPPYAFSCQERRMIPTRYDYYRRRAREHRNLAQDAASTEQRAMHEKLVSAYGELARKYRTRQTLSLRI